MAETIFDAKFLLPGLKLVGSKDVEIPDDVKSLTKDGSILVFLKKFEDNLGFLRGTEVLLEAMYQTGGTPSNVETKDEQAADDDEDKKGKSDDEEEPSWDELTDKFDERELDDLVQERELAEKRVDSPSIEGYDCFLLKPEEVWTSAKNYSEIELDFFTAERAVSNLDELLRPDNRGVPIGESFVLDLTDSSNPMKNNVVLLEWDMSCIVMKEIASPSDFKVLKRESEIDDEILLLGVHSGSSFDPTKPFVVHVHLHDYLQSGYGKLKLKLYKHVEIEVDSKKAFDDAVDTCIEKSCMRDDPVGTVSSSGVPKDDYVKFEIKPEILLQILQDSEEEDSEANFFSVMEEQENKADAIESILDAIETAQFAAVIEDDGSNKLVAKFTLSSIAANNMYFDSAVQMLKEPKNRSPEKITIWSNMTLRTAQSSWDSIYTRAAYKVTRSESTPWKTDNASQKFLVKVALPEINQDVAPIQPKNITLLIENCNSDLSFVGKKENIKFLYVRDAVDIYQSGDDRIIEFEWSAIDRVGEERDSEMKVSIILELEDENGEKQRPKKIGQTISVLQKVGGTSKQHSTMVKLRNMVKMGFENASVLQGSVSSFLEVTFKMAYLFSIPDEQSIKSTSFLGKAADDISNRFYKIVADKGESVIYKKIRKSDLFLLRPFEDTNAIEVSELADFIVEIFQSIAAFDLIGWARSITLDEDALKLLVEGDQNIEKVFETYVGNLRQVFGLNSTEVAKKLQEYPELMPKNFPNVMQRFVETAQQIRYEIDFPKGVEITDNDFFSEASARNIEIEAQEIVESFDREFPSTAFAFETPEEAKIRAEEVSAMEIKLLELLETAAEACDNTIFNLEETELILDEVHSYLDDLRNIGDNLKTLSTNARSLYNFCNRFWQVLGVLAQAAIGPLAVVKGIYSGMKVPMKMILNAMANGERKVSGLTKKVDAKMKKVVSADLVKRVRSLKTTVGKPKTAIEKFRELIDMVIKVASFGFLPISIISKFASSSSLQDFFQTWDESISSVRSTLYTLYQQSKSLLGPMRQMRDFANTIASKIGFLRPVDSLMKRLQPFVHTIQGLFNRFKGWWRYLLNGALWPVEQAINLIIYPFRRQINIMIQKLNPFGIIDSLMAPLVSPLDALPTFSLFDSKLNLLSQFQAMAQIPEFDGMAATFTVAVAILQRGLFGILDFFFSMGVNNIGVFEQLVGTVQSNATLKELLDDMKKEFPSNTLGDLILDMKKKSIEEPLVRCNSYLLMNASNDSHTYTDQFTKARMESYVGNSNYDLLHCEINPSDDAVSPLFEHGTAKDGKANNSWMMGPMAVLLHYSKLTEQGEKIGALSSNDKVHISFLPERGNTNGQYRVSLYTKKSGSNQTFVVDSRLPLQKVPYPKLESAEEIPTQLLDYANERILARVNSAFSEKYSLALVEKVVALKINISPTESVGTGMYLLCGNLSGLCYKREGKRWRKYLANQSVEKSNGYASVTLQETNDVIEEEVLEGFVKTRTISLEDAERLESFIRADPDNINLYDRSTMEEIMKNMSMFVIVTASNGDCFPILHTDNSEKKNLVYGNGTRMQPLFNLSDVSEMWEFAITRSTPITEQLSVSTSSTSTSTVQPSLSSTNNPGATRVYSGDSIIPIRRSVTSRATPPQTRSGAESIRSFATASAGDGVPPGAPPRASTATYDRTVRGITTSVADPRLKKILQQAFQSAYVGAKFKRSPNSRTIKVYDYVRNGNTVALITNYIGEKKGFKGTKDVVKQWKVTQLRDGVGAIWDKDKTRLCNEKNKDDNILAVLRYHRREIFKDKDKNSDRLRLQKDVTLARFWGLTLQDLKDYIDFCKEQFPVKWGRSILKNSDRYMSLKSLSDNFIKKHTSGLGSGIALNMKNTFNRGAEVFVSVSWDESIEQVITMLENRVRSKLKNGKEFLPNTMIWLAPFSLYQAEDVVGPSVEQQLAGGVFEEVLKTAKDMFVLQTSNCDPFSRLWCVSELLTATEVRKEDPRRYIPRDLQIQGVFSRDFREKYVRDGAKTYKYGWEDVGNGVKVYTRKLSSEESRRVLDSGKTRSGSRNYVLMRVGEWGRRKYMELQPILRLNVQGGLTNFNEYPRSRASDRAECKRLDEYYSDKPVDKFKLWFKLQENIVKLQADSLGVEPDVANTSLMYNFVAEFEPKWGSNDNQIRQFIGNSELKRRAETVLGYTPEVIDPDDDDRPFLLFRNDNDATEYFKRVAGIDPDFSPDLRYLLSFGSKDPEGGFEFDQILWVADSLESTYVDARFLPPLAASYKLIDTETGKAGNPRNSFWIEYYQRAMRTAKVMTFIITKGWVDSPNTWEEFEWATQIRNEGDYKNVFVFQHVPTREMLMEGSTPKPFVTAFDERKVTKVRAPHGQYNWKTLMEKLKKKSFITATTREQIVNEVRKFM